MIEACKVPEMIVSTIGVGKDVDRTMMLALANAGRGYCEFLEFKYDHNSIQQKVNRCLNGMQVPYIDNLEISWIVNGVTRSQRTLGRLFKDQLFRQSFILSKDEDLKDLQVKLTHSGDQEIILTGNDFRQEDEDATLFYSAAMQEVQIRKFT